MYGNNHLPTCQFNQTYYKTSGLTSTTITTNGNNICQIMAKQPLAITSTKQLKQICPNKIAGHSHTVTPIGVGND